MENKIALVSFTDRGRELAERIAAALPCDCRDAHADPDFSLQDWTRAAFTDSSALVFIGAAGIAVRAIAPNLRSKAEDPAVVCLDEAGRFVVPLLSGHLGGANELARRLAALIGGTAVITTATDLNRVFAVDLWAKRQGMFVWQPERIKRFSARCLAGDPAKLVCPWPIAGEPPAPVVLSGEGDAVVDFHVRRDGALQLVPRELFLGIGCRRGISAGQLEIVFDSFCQARELLPQAIVGAASIDRKSSEAGLLAFCREKGLPVRFFSAEELAAAEGEYAVSAFVESIVGVNNVCERAAVLASEGGTLVEEKYAMGGVTFALAMRAPRWDWSW